MTMKPATGGNNMTATDEEEEFFGNGIYVRWDGYAIKLRIDSTDDDDFVMLNKVVNALVEVQKWWVAKEE
jgi:hypothetical protein